METLKIESSPASGHVGEVIQKQLDLQEVLNTFIASVLQIYNTNAFKISALTHLDLFRNFKNYTHLFSNIKKLEPLHFVKSHTLLAENESISRLVLFLRI